MDNCNLERFIVKPGKLNPKFGKDVVDYTVTLGIKDPKTTLDFFTEDSGASYQIFVEGGDGSKTITIEEGGTKKVRIEVTADDGKTTKNYFVTIKRHSSKAAVLDSLIFSKGELVPKFVPDSYDYNLILSLLENEIDVSFTVPDSKSIVKINGNEPKNSYTLNLGLTCIEINVTSPDGNNNKTYKIKCIKKDINIYSEIIDISARFENEDSLSLCPCLKGVNIDENQSYDFMNKKTAQHFIDLKRNKSKYLMKEMIELENKLSNLECQVLLPNMVLSDPIKLRSVSTIIKYSKSKENRINLNYSFNPFNDTINLTPEWQQKLIPNELLDSNDDLMKKYNEKIENYFIFRPKCPDFNSPQTITNDNPSIKLTEAIGIVATMCNKQKSVSKNHFMLGQLLEEYYLLEDIYNIKMNKLNSIDEIKQAANCGGADSNSAAIVTAKQDEILAICHLHGYTASNPSDTEQLLALDKEYHSLISQNQSSKADAIQNLFEWKSKRCSQEASMRSEMENETSIIGQSFYKYKCALSLDKKSTIFNYHVGRLNLIQGKYQEASNFFHTALSNDKNHLPSKLCLGLASTLIPNGSAKQISEGLCLIADALEVGFEQIINCSCVIEECKTSNQKFINDDTIFFTITNPLISRSILMLAKNLLNHPNLNITVPEHILFHWSLQLSVQGWTEVGHGTCQNQFEQTIIECHKYLLMLLIKEAVNQENIMNHIIINRCLWLLSFINTSSVPMNSEILTLKEDISKVLLYHDPTNIAYLSYYGDSMTLKAGQMIAKDDLFKSTIEKAIKILLLAYSIKNKKTGPEEAKKIITEETWYKSNDLLIFKLQIKQSQKNEKQSQSTKTTQSTPTPTKTTSIKPAPTSTPKTPIKPSPAVVPAKKTGVASGVGRGKPITVKSGQVQATSNKQQPKPKEIAADTTKDPKENVKTEENSDTTEKSAVFNYNRIIKLDVNDLKIEQLIARAYSINGQYEESVKYFKLTGLDKNITVLNDLTLEYLDVLICAKDYDSALQVYYKLHINWTNPTFDDGYICGEIVRLLMKIEKYTDPNLIKYAALWAKIFGFGILEKDIKILEDKNQTNVCREIYASIHNKKVDDPDIQMFFKSKCWV